jgi:hypothetical protein
VGRYWPNRGFTEILQEAADLAAFSDNPYSAVACVAWPVRALLERGSAEAANAIIRRAIPTAQTIENQGGRSEALLLLLHAVLPYEDRQWRPVLDELIKASEPVRSWRQPRNFQFAWRLIWAKDPELTSELTVLISDRTLRKVAEKVVETGLGGLPRPFFWQQK